MESSAFIIGVYILIPILSAVLGGWVGAYFGNKYRKSQEDKKMQKVRDIAIKALNIIKKYDKQPYTNVENQFNTDLSIAQKRTIVVLLHKLGIPIIVPANESFNIHQIHFSYRIVDENEIDGIILQVTQKHCDNLFFIDAENYFNANRQYTALREVGKKYVRNVLAKSVYNNKTNKITYPEGWVSGFGLGEYLSIRILHEQAQYDIIYNQSGNADSDKIEQMIHEIDMGLWDNCLSGNYELFKNSKAQIEMSNIFQTLAKNTQQATAHIGTPPIAEGN